MEKYYYHVQCMVFSVVCSFLNNFAKLVFSLVLYECKHMQTKSFVMDPKAITSRSSQITRCLGSALAATTAAVAAVASVCLCGQRSEATITHVDYRQSRRFNHKGQVVLVDMLDLLQYIINIDHSELRPVLLPCGHSLCQGCWTSWEKCDHTKNVFGIECPFCRCPILERAVVNPLGLSLCSGSSLVSVVISPVHRGGKKDIIAVL